MSILVSYLWVNSRSWLVEKSEFYDWAKNLTKHRYVEFISFLGLSNFRRQLVIKLIFQSKLDSPWGNDGGGIWSTNHKSGISVCSTISSDEKDINEAKVSGGAKSQMSHICENIGYKNDGWRHMRWQ